MKQVPGVANNGLGFAASSGDQFFESRDLRFLCERSLAKGAGPSKASSTAERGLRQRKMETSAFIVNAIACCG